MALLISSIFLLQNCATVILGTHQKIPVTSSPLGAKILVDGKEMGYTPLNLKLERRKKVQIIRIEKPDYNPLEIKITRKTSNPIFWIPGIIIFNGAIGAASGFIIGNAIANFLGLITEEEEHVSGIETGIRIGVIFGLVESLTAPLSGILSTLSPKELNVTLTKIEGKLQPNFILIDAEQFHNIKWIRIKCIDNDKEEIVNID